MLIKVATRDHRGTHSSRRFECSARKTNVELRSDAERSPPLDSVPRHSCIARVQRFRQSFELGHGETARRRPHLPISDPRAWLIEPLRLAGSADTKRECRVAIEVERFGCVRGSERVAIRSERDRG
jgi:hypothetical protein